MRLFFLIGLILTSFLALTSHNILTNKDSTISSTSPTDTTNGIIIQNSLPKGDGYFNPAGKRFPYAVFWTRVRNETATSVELTINFPADSFAISRQPNDYVKFFLPPDKMTLDKVPLYNYGLTGLKDFLDTNINKPTQLQITIKPKEEALFYILVVSDKGYNGAVRSGLVLKDEKLFYKTNMLDSLLPCGHVVFKK